MSLSAKASSTSISLFALDVIASNVVRISGISVWPTRNPPAANSFVTRGSKSDLKTKKFRELKTKFYKVIVIRNPGSGDKN